jgi:hypothetical protein
MILGVSLDLFAGIPVSDRRPRKAIYRDSDGNEISFGGAIE